MKNILILLFVAVTFLAITPGAESANPKAVIEWDATSLDLGEVIFNEPVEATFTFRNPGMVPLMISEVKPSCGCTVAEFPKKPIGPGGTGTIKVTYDAKTPGFFSKTISVYSNSQEGLTQLYVKGTVVKK